MYKIAVIGVGNISSVHFDVYKNIENVCIVAAVEKDKERAKKCADTMHINVYQTLEEMLQSEEVDIIDICLPTFLHKEFILKGLKEGLHVICEKPIALNAKEGQEIIQTAKESKGQLMIGHCLRFCEDYNALKEMIDNKAYGDLQILKLFRHVSMPHKMEKEWFFDNDKSGGIALDLYIHDIDMMNYLLGKPERATKVEQKRYIMGIYEYDHAVVNVEASWRAQEKYEFCSGYEAVFEEATVICTNGNMKVITEEVIEKVIVDENSQIEPEFMKMYYNEFKYFIDCIEQGISPLKCEPENSLESLKLVLNGLCDTK